MYYILQLHHIIVVSVKVWLCVPGNGAGTCLPDVPTAVPNAPHRGCWRPLDLRALHYAKGTDIS